MSLAIATPFTSNATVVEVQTSLGNFQINLFDEATPATVENFLSYVNSGAYANTVSNRVIPGFIIQSGGFANPNGLPFSVVQSGSVVVNEPVLSNVRGTISMAKQLGVINSATNQWFINVANNANDLDSFERGGFTAFGQVLRNGMEIVDAIANTPNFSFEASFGGNYRNVPLRNYTTDDLAAGTLPTEENFIIITDIVVVDAAVVTNPNLNPTPNTLYVEGGSNPGTPTDSGDSGGTTGALLVSFLAAFAFLRRFKKA